jgi:hypothetical protein
MDGLSQQEMFDASGALRAAGDVSRNLRTAASQAGHLLYAIPASGRRVSIAWDDADGWTVALHVPSCGDVDFVESDENLVRALHTVIMDALRADTTRRGSTEGGV